MSTASTEDVPDFGIIGTQQSPIVIDPDRAIQIDRGYGHLQFRYATEVCGTFQADTKNFVVNADEGASKLVLKEGHSDWYLRKIHMHNHVEHRVKGVETTHFEFHLIHSALHDPGASGDKLVVGVFFRLDEKAERSEELQRLNRSLREARQKGGEVGGAFAIHPYSLLPRSASERDHWYHYMGSLTSCPYSENVSWYVLQREIPVHGDDVDAIRENACQDSRPPFPLYRRFVLKNVPRYRAEASGGPLA